MADLMAPYRLAADMAHQLDAERGRSWRELAARVDRVRILARAASALTVDLIPGRTLPPVEVAGAALTSALCDVALAALVAVASLGLDPGATLALHADQVRQRRDQAAREGAADTVDLGRPIPPWDGPTWPTLDRGTGQTWPPDQGGRHAEGGGADHD